MTMASSALLLLLKTDAESGLSNRVPLKGDWQDLLQFAPLICDNPYEGLLPPEEHFSYTIHNKRLYVAVEGTHGNIDWLHNFTAKMHKLHSYVPDPSIPTDVEVHVGMFVRFTQHIGWSLSRGNMKGLAERDLSSITSHTIVGHSLGGALANFLAVWGLHHFLPNLPQASKLYQLVTFGTPKHGNQAWRTYYNNKFATSGWRVASSRDPVPKSPTPAKWKHAGPNEYIFKGPGGMPGPRHACYWNDIRAYPVIN